MSRPVMSKIEAYLKLLDARGAAELLVLLEAVLRRQARRSERKLVAA